MRPAPKAQAKRKTPRPTVTPVIPANLSRNHPDYGKPISVHVTNKLERNGKAY